MGEGLTAATVPTMEAPPLVEPLAEPEPEPEELPLPLSEALPLPECSPSRCLNCCRSRWPRAGRS